MATSNCLVINILLNIFFCVQQNKKMYTCVEQLEGKQMLTDLTFLCKEISDTLVKNKKQTFNSKIMTDATHLIKHELYKTFKYLYYYYIIQIDLFKVVCSSHTYYICNTYYCISL